MNDSPEFPMNEDTDGKTTFDFLSAANAETTVAHAADSRRTRPNKEKQLIFAILAVLAANYLARQIMPGLPRDPIPSAPSLDVETILHELNNKHESTSESC